MSVDELTGVLGAVFLGQVNGLVNAHLGRNVLSKGQLIGAYAQDGPINDRHAVDVPVLGGPGDVFIEDLDRLDAPFYDLQGK